MEEIKEGQVWKDKDTHYSIEIHHFDNNYVWVTYIETGDAFPFAVDKFYERFERV
jgi:hypothetical protein